MPNVEAVLTDALAAFSQSANIFGNTTVRLAIVCKSSLPTATIQEANETILDKLGFAIPFQDSGDLFFQINRRAKLSSVAGVEINRVLGWSVEHFQSIDIVAGNTTVSEIDMATLSVDTNTVPSQKVFTVAEQASILGEMRDEVLRLTLANDLKAL